MFDPNGSNRGHGLAGSVGVWLAEAVDARRASATGPVEGSETMPVDDDAVTAYEAMWWLQVWHGDPRLTPVSDLNSTAALPDELFEAADAGLPDHLIAEGLGRLVRDAAPSS